MSELQSSACLSVESLQTEAASNLGCEIMLPCSNCGHPLAVVTQHEAMPGLECAHATCSAHLDVLLVMLRGHLGQACLTNASQQQSHVRTRILSRYSVAVAVDVVGVSPPATMTSGGPEGHAQPAHHLPCPGLHVCVHARGPACATHDAPPSRLGGFDGRDSH